MKKKWNGLYKSYSQKSKLLFKMKLLAFLLFASIATVSANSYSQQTTFNFNFEDITVSQVFQKIEANSEFIFIYSEKSVDVNRKVNISVEKKKVNFILDQLFEGTNNSYEINDRQITVLSKKEKIGPIKSIRTEVQQTVQPQKKTINGRVTDITGEPLPGASIIVKGTTVGITTDFNGNYSLEIPDDAKILVYSFVGMKQQEVEIGNRTQISVVLEDDFVGIEEVVAVGYGYQKRSNLTGAIDQVNAEKIAARPVSNIVQALQGVMPGLNVKTSNGDLRAENEINIRGFNSINGGSPLVLIDGIAGDMNLINPSDVETITVLKDAASAAIYGARGAFGVILITTKKGSKGEPKITYNDNFAFTTPAARTDFVSNSYDYANIINDALYGYNGGSYTPYYDEQDWETLRKVADGEIEGYQELQSNGKYNFFHNTDWYDYLFRKWQTAQNHTISVSGGTDRIKAYVSGRYYKSNTIQKIVDEDIIKYNLKSNISFKINDWLEIFNDIQYNFNDNTEFGGNKSGWADTWTYTKNYLYAFIPNKIDGVSYDYRGDSDHASLETGNSWKRNYSKQFGNTFSVKLTPIKDLVVNFDYSKKITNTGSSTRLVPFDYLVGSRITPVTTGLNRLTEVRAESTYNALNLFATYTKTFAESHNFKILVGYNQEDFDEDLILGEQGGLLNDNFSNLNLGTEVLRADGSASLWAVQGYFGRLNYDYKNRYLLEINTRYDGSSRFPEDSRWGLFPSVSAGWYLSHEKFWAPIQDAIGTFKLRASYGKLGNQNIGLYTFSQLLTVGQSSWLANNAPLNYIGAPAPLPGVVTWEKTTTTDVGFDLGVIKNKLTASFDLYEKKTTEMYLPGQPLPAVFGATEPKENIADVTVKGFELTLTYKTNFNVKDKPLHFSASANISNFTGTITKFPNPEGIMSTFWEGQKLGEIWGYHVDGQFQSDEEAQAYQNSFENPTADLGQVYKFIVNIAKNEEWKGLRAGDIKFVDLDGDGEISKGNNSLDDHGDLQKIGNAMPQFPFGFNLNADWNGIDFSMVGVGVANQDWYPEGKIYWGPYERPYMTFIRKDLYDDAWSPENTSGKYPQKYRGYTAMQDTRSLGAVNDYYLTNVGYLRIKNLTLGYTLPQELTKKAKIERLRLYVSAENVFTVRFGDLTKYIDPEQAGSGISFSNPGSAVSRSNVGDYPIGKTFSIGINVTL